MPEESSFSIDWKMAVLGALVLIGLVTTSVVAALEGLPWITRSEMAQHDQIWQGKLDTLTGIQTTNASQLTANNAQLTTLTVQVATMATKQEADEKEIDELMQKRINSLKQDLRQKELADKLNREHYEREVERMEHAHSVGL